MRYRLALAATALTFAIQAGAETAIQSASALTTEWIQIENQHSRLLRDWAQTQEALEQQIRLLKAERELLQETLQANKGDRDEVAQAREELLAQQEQMEADQQRLQEVLESASVALRSLQPQLPPPLQQKWQEPMARLTGTSSSASEKLQALLALQGDFDAFNQRIALHTTTMSLSDGRDILADQIYLGVSQGWYISADGKHFGTGRPTPMGWRWQEQTDLDPAQLQRIVAILHAEDEAALTPVPVHFREEAL